MTAVDNTPSNRNFLASSTFTFKIKKAPHVNFYIQKVNIPAMTLPAVNVGNEFVTTPYPGDHIIYEPLSLEFMVDEDLNNYLEIHNWLIGMGKPESYQQYADLANQPEMSGLGIYSDVTLHILSSLYASNYEVTFMDAFPISLSQLEFDTTKRDKVFLTAIAKFRYTKYDIVSI